MYLPEVCFTTSMSASVVNWVVLYLVVGMCSSDTSQPQTIKLEVAVWPLKWFAFLVFVIYHLPRVFRQVRSRK